MLVAPLSLDQQQMQRLPFLTPFRDYCIISREYPVWYEQKAFDNVSSKTRSLIVLIAL